MAGKAAGLRGFEVGSAICLGWPVRPGAEVLASWTPRISENEMRKCFLGKRSPAGQRPGAVITTGG